MTYGTSSLDLGKGIVLWSCVFHVAMIAWIATDVHGVIASPYGGGWWDPLRMILAWTKNEEEESSSAASRISSSVAIYPRMWAFYLLFQLAVRLNWVFTVEPAPALYRCVLLSYALPLAEFYMECWYFQTLPMMDLPVLLMMIVPWFVILTQYNKYTYEPTTTGDTKKPNIKSV